MTWYGVRTVCRFAGSGDVPPHYEELGLVQSYEMADPIGAGAEVYSLMRTSDLEPDDYLDRFFDTGEERQRAL